MSIATLDDIDFVTALQAAYDGADPAWPTAVTPAQALAVADLYGVDGEVAGTVYGQPEVDAVIAALCRLAKAYREAVL